MRDRSANRQDLVRALEQAKPSRATRVRFDPADLILVLLLGLPVGYWGAVTGRPVVAFFGSAAAIIPLAYLIGLSTEAVAVRLGPGLGSVVLATLSNAVELIIGFLALEKGLTRVVQAAITGSIIANILLVLGSAMLSGGLKWKRQEFGGKAANVQTTVLLLGALALFLPALTERIVDRPVDLNRMSVYLAAGLLVTYVLGLVFTLRTHKHLFDPVGEEAALPKSEALWSVRKSVLVLGVATLLATAAAEVLTGSIEAAATALGWSDLFVGAIVLAIVANAAEHASSVTLALKNRMTSALQVCTASSIQIALFVAPLLVFASQWLAHPLTLAFSLFEVVAIGASVLVLNLVAYDGESNWFEGALLVMVYAVIAATFFFVPG